jgi:hypothetical protein
MPAARSLRPKLVDAISTVTLISLVFFQIGQTIDVEGRDDSRPSSTSAPQDASALLTLQSLAHDSFFHFVEPGFSPFICSRRAQHLHHPLVFRLTDEAFTELRVMRATILRIDAAILHTPDADTGECPSFPDARSVENISWCDCPPPNSHVLKLFSQVLQIAHIQCVFS